MLDISIVNETSPEANRNKQTGRKTGRQAGRQADPQDHILSQADALTNKAIGFDIKSNFNLNLVSVVFLLKASRTVKIP